MGLKLIYQGGHHAIYCNGAGVHYRQLDDCKDGLGHEGQMQLVGYHECEKWVPPCGSRSEAEKEPENGTR